MVLVLFRNLTEKDKSSAVEHLIKASTPNQDFFFMVILSILTATFGLLIGNVAVIIGSMLIAPILYPFLSLSLGITMSDSNLITRSFYTIVKSAVFGIVAAAITTLLFANQLPEVTVEIISRTEPSISYIVIAIIAGLAGSFAFVKPQLSETLPGIAISVALIPPLAVIGIGLAKLNFLLISGAFLFFVVNAAGVIFASMLTFSMMNFYLKKDLAEKTIKKEEEKVVKEKKLIEESQNKS